MMMPVTMNATVREVREGSLLVCDHSTNQTVVVHTPHPCRFSPGDEVCIHYSGVMTMSLPPQISATCITKVSSCRNDCR